MKKDEEKRTPSSYAEGLLSILSVLQNASRTVEEIFLLPSVARDDKKLFRLFSMAKKRGIPMTLSDETFFDSVTTGHTHGGVIARVGERKMLTPEEVFDRAGGFAFLLCGIEDPFNFGSAVRSLYAAGAGGMFLAPRNWTVAAGVTIRASAGCTEALPCAVYEDPAHLCALARARGYCIVCAGEKGSESLFSADLSQPVLLIVGGEKRGISRIFLENADTIVRIPYGRPFSGSLTTASAAAVCAFEILRVKLQSQEK